MTEKTMTGVGARLQASRLLAKLSARELDRLAGKAEGHASLIEARKDSNVMAGTLQAYSEVLGCSLDWLIAGKGEPPTQEQVQVAVAVARSLHAA